MVYFSAVGMVNALGNTLSEVRRESQYRAGSGNGTSAGLASGGYTDLARCS